MMTNPTLSLSIHKEIQPPKLSYYNQAVPDSLEYVTLGQQVALSAKRYGNREGFIASLENVRYSFTEILQKADELAAAFLKIGLKPGDKIGILAPNCTVWYLSFLAASRAGLVSVPVNWLLERAEIAYCIKKVDMRAIITLESYGRQKFYDMLCKEIPELSISEPGQLRNEKFDQLTTVIIGSKSKLPGTFSIDEILKLPTKSDIDEIEQICNKIQPSDPCYIQFTSGTTGSPKGAVISNFCCINGGKNSVTRFELFDDIEHHKICLQNPLFHILGSSGGVIVGLLMGATLCLPGFSFNAKETLQAINKEKLTMVFGTPTMFVDMLKKKTEMNIEIDSLKFTVAGGAPISPQLTKDMISSLGLKKIKNAYGMTEKGCGSFLSGGEETIEQMTENVGKLLDHLEAKVVDRNGRTVPMGEPGELCIRGYATMIEYYKDEEKTKEVFTKDKWFKTGDQFILSENGYGKIVGRYKELIIRGGENIYPKEIEDFLNSHSEIFESHIIGVPDERLGEEICAFLRTTEKGKNLTRQDIIEYAKGKLAYFKIPKYVNHIDIFPINGAGKIQKFKLAEIFNNESENCN